MLPNPRVAEPPQAPAVTVPAPREVDLATECAFRTAVRDAVAAAGPGGRVVVDFAGVEFCDSTAVTVLLEGRAAAQADGCLLEVTSPPPQLRRIAELLSETGRLGLS